MRDKAVAPPPFTPSRNAGRGYGFQAKATTFQHVFKIRRGSSFGEKAPVPAPIQPESTVVPAFWLAQMWLLYPEIEIFGGLTMTEEKTRIHTRISPETEQKITAAMPLSNCRSQNEFVEKAKSADGFVFGSPVYFAHPSGRLLTFMDRAFYSGGAAFQFKPAAAVLSARRAGTTASFDVINKYFTICSMPVVSSTYWNHVYLSLIHI